MKTLTIIGVSLAAFAASSEIALAQENRQFIDFGGVTWELQGEYAGLETHLDRPSLALRKARLWADEANFSDGVISYKVAYPEHRAFIGTAWRTQDRKHSEEMYFRAHLNNTPDSIQYTPVNNTLSAWQIYSDGNAIAPVQQSYSDWNDVKIVVKGDQADIYFNSETPVLHIPDLKNDFESGGIVMRSSNRSDDTTYFSDLSIRALTEVDQIIGTPKDPKPVPDGLIETWSVSSPFDEAILEGPHLPGMSDLTWQDLSVETNGIANLGRLYDPQDGVDTVFLRHTLISESPDMKVLTFGFSDRVKIYLNGDLLFAGNDGFRTRDYRFLGLIGFHDQIGLPLNAGENELMIAVSETFGGWGFAGALSDTGL